MDAFQILVIILAAFLALFLALGIVLLILFINISLKVKRVTENLGDATDSLRCFAHNLQRLASPVVISQIVLKYIRNLIKRRPHESKR